MGTSDLRVRSCDGRGGRQWCLAGMVGLLTSAVAMGQATDALVTITGGADQTAHNYSWTVRNHDTSPIVYLEFPHYRADLFTTPAGWEQKGTTYLVNIGVADKPGVCIARPVPPHPGIVRGASASFGMRVAQRRGLLGKNTVTVRFADGKEVRVKDVELPVPPEETSKYVPLIGMGVLFVVFVAYRTIRNRRAAGSDGVSEEESAEHG